MEFVWRLTVSTLASNSSFLNLKNVWVALCALFLLGCGEKISESSSKSSLYEYQYNKKLKSYSGSLQQQGHSKALSAENKPSAVKEPESPPALNESEEESPPVVEQVSLEDELTHCEGDLNYLKSFCAQFPEWLNSVEASDEHLVIAFSDNKQLVTWKKGVWEKGHWKGNVWESGTWKSGVWEGGVWENGIWQRGLWRNGEWRDGEWEGGCWMDGSWENGLWEDGNWINGVWKGGAWEEGRWNNGSCYGDQCNHAITLGLSYSYSYHGCTIATKRKRKPRF